MENAVMREKITQEIEWKGWLQEAVAELRSTPYGKTGKPLPTPESDAAFTFRPADSEKENWRDAVASAAGYHRFQLPTFLPDQSRISDFIFGIACAFKYLAEQTSLGEPVLVGIVSADVHLMGAAKFCSGKDINLSRVSDHFGMRVGLWFAGNYLSNCTRFHRISLED